MRWEAQPALVGKNADVTMYPSAPVALPSGDPTAVVGRRIGAAIIDYVVIGAIVWAILFFGIFAEKAPSSGVLDDCAIVREVGDDPVICFDFGDNIYATQGGDTMALVALSVLVGLANHVFLQGATGATVGKRVVGLRVVKKDTGQIATFGPNALRWLVGLFDVGCCFLIALIMVFVTKGHRRLGDMAANTLVVGTESVGIPPVVPGLTSPQFSGSPYATSYPPSSPMSPPQAASPSGWPPPSPAAPAPTPPPAQGGAAAANTPTWDPQRNTYVIFDGAQNQWMQWDATSQQWRPIS
jgi:uncharacterized RDD family membrane protein YckC